MTRVFREILVMIEAKFDKDDLKRVKRSFNAMKKLLSEGSHVLLAMKTWALLVENSAKRLVNVNTGALRDRINSFIFEQSVNIITMKVSTRSKAWKPTTSDIPYEWFLEYGTEPHWVAPTKGKALAWQSGGNTYFSKGHEVSGIRATRFMQRAYLLNKAKGEALLRAAIIKEMRKAK